MVSPSPPPAKTNGFAFEAASSHAGSRKRGKEWWGAPSTDGNPASHLRNRLAASAAVPDSSAPWHFRAEATSPRCNVPVLRRAGPKLPGWRPGRCVRPHGWGWRPTRAASDRLIKLPLLVQDDAEIVVRITDEISCKAPADSRGPPLPGYPAWALPRLRCASVESVNRKRLAENRGRRPPVAPAPGERCPSCCAHPRAGG